MWAARFIHAGRDCQTRFEYTGARLPVSTLQGARILLLPWGRRPQETGAFPVGGWARLSQIQAGLWDAFVPRPVKLPILAFAERDVTGREHWFEVTRGQHIQGCAIRMGHECRLYVVTLDCSPLETEFERWPRLVTTG